MRNLNKIYQSDLKTALANSLQIGQLAGKSILITGATGTIGSFLVDEFIEYNKLHQNKIEIFATSRSLEHLQNVFQEESAELHFIEFNNQQPIKFDFRVDYIIHNAGNAYPSAFKQDPIGTIMGNTVGTYNLLQYARQNKIKRFLYISSGEIYGQKAELTTEFNEDYTGHVEPLSSRSCYPNSKRMCETLCASFFEQYHLDIVVVRPCHTYGPRITDNDNRAHVQFLKAALQDIKITLKSQGRQLRSYCYVADCAAGIITALLKGQTNCAYNIANSSSVTTIKNLAETIAKLAGKRIEYCKLERTRDDSPIQHQVLDADRLEKLGWQGKYDLVLGLRHTLSIMQQEELEKNAREVKTASL